MSAQVAINIPDLEPHCDSWTVVRKDTTVMVHQYMSRDMIERYSLDPEQFEVLTRHQYLGRLNAQSVIHHGAKDLLEQIDVRKLAGHKHYAALAEALRAFIK
jgi:hypothetical protein